MKTSTFKSTLVVLASILFIPQNYAYVNTYITVKGAQSSDQMWVFSIPTCTRSFDNGWDGYKMIASSASVQLYAAEATGNFQVDAVPTLNNTVIAFKAGIDREYTLTFTNQTLSLQYTQLYLIDSVANKVVDIYLSGTEYAFTAEATETAVKRFKLVTTNPNPVVEVVPVVVPVAEPVVVPVPEPVVVPVVEPVAVVVPVAEPVVVPVVVPEPVVVPVVEPVAVVVPVVVPVPEPVVVPEVVPVVVPVVEPIIVPVVVPVVDPIAIDDKNKKDKKDKKDKIKNIEIFSSNKTIVVENKSKQAGNLKVYNARTGRSVKTQRFNANGVTRIPLNVPAGTYIAKAATANEEISITLIIQ